MIQLCAAGIAGTFRMGRALAEVEVINKIDESLAKRIYGIPYLPQENLLLALLEFYEPKQTLTTK